VDRCTIPGARRNGLRRTRPVGDTLLHPPSVTQGCKGRRRLGLGRASSLTCERRSSWDPPADRRAGATETAGSSGGKPATRIKQAHGTPGSIGLSGLHEATAATGRQAQPGKRPTRLRRIKGATENPGSTGETAHKAPPDQGRHRTPDSTGETGQPGDSAGSRGHGPPGSAGSTGATGRQPQTGRNRPQEAMATRAGRHRRCIQRSRQLGGNDLEQWGGLSVLRQNWSSARRITKNLDNAGFTVAQGGYSG